MATDVAYHERIKRRLDAWVWKFSRQQRAQQGELQLKQKQVYILPSRMGLAYVLVLGLMLIAAINYKLALGYALTFLLASIAWVGLFHCWRNLLGLSLRNGRGESVFAGELAELSLTLRNPSKTERYALHLETASMAQVVNIDLAPNSEQVVRLALHTEQRGWLNCPRFRLSTHYPLGLWRAWAYWYPAVRVLIYAAPEIDGPALPALSAQHGEGSSQGKGTDDFSALRQYREGDSPRHIAWKAIARSGSDRLLTKEFEGGAKGELILDWDSLPSNLDAEAKLSRLTRWVLDAEQAGIRYGLQLPNKFLPTNSGKTHQQLCLSELALVGLAPPGMTERRSARQRIEPSV